jgi:septal ring factor EnvC (AmiA/AmiB activator)
MPAAAAAHLPSTATQYHALESEIAKSRPLVEDAKRQSDALKASVAALRQQMIKTAARIQQLEQQKLWLDAEVGKLARDSARLSERFREQRTEVGTLLAAVQRMQHDTPPVIAIRAGDAIGAAHTSMLLGATLSRLYAAAGDLAHRLAALEHTRTDLAHRRAEAATNAAVLASTRTELDQLLAMKSKEADEADASYGDLASRLDAAASEASNLDAVLRKAEALRATAAAHDLVVVAARDARSAALPASGALQPPVVGRMVEGDGTADGASRAPGVSFIAPPEAQVVAPADSKVLFAGRYHKTEQVLILQMARGYALVLAGLGRIDVRSGDLLLAGEPIGRMPHDGAEMRLYFELRQNGKGVSPAPWLESNPGKVRKS